MPCQYDPDPEELRREARFNDVRTRLACGYCRWLESIGEGVPEWAREWWDYHQKIDAEREAQRVRDASEERARRKALSKLSASERRALGLK